MVDKRFEMTMPALSMTLLNSDGSYLAEMLFKEFNFKMISYMDTAKKFTVVGKQFYILDKVSNVGNNVFTKAQNR